MCKGSLEIYWLRLTLHIHRVKLVVAILELNDVG